MKNIQHKTSNDEQRHTTQLLFENEILTEPHVQRRALIQKLIRKQEVEALRRRRLAFNNQEETVFVYMEDIIRIEAKGNCCCIYALGQTKLICVTINLGKIISQYELDQVPFLFQIHRSHLVNLQYVVKMDKRDGDTLILKSGEQSFEVPIAQRCKAALLERLIAV